MGDTVYFGFGWVDVNQPGGGTNGCVSADGARVIVPNTNVSLTTTARLSSVLCRQGFGLVTAIAPREAFTIAAP